MSKKPTLIAPLKIKIDTENINYKKKYEFDLPEISIVEQQKNVTILDLEYDYQNFYFNSCIFEFQNKKYIILRHSYFIGSQLSSNSLKIYDVENKRLEKLNVIDEIKFEQYEDPRVFVYKNKIYVSCATYIHGYENLIHQKILIFNDKFEHIGNIHPQYGKNSNSHLKNLGQEKNWTFFIINDDLFCVYSINPHIVLKFDWNGKLIEQYVTNFDSEKFWKYGQCRGGTNPLFINNRFESFFHSSVPWKNNKKRYLMSNYQFNFEPPFEILNMNANPILWGNESEDFLWKDKNPLVVFPCGAIVDDQNILISFGVNDEKTGLIVYKK